jgi:hypothetical protein
MGHKPKIHSRFSGVHSLSVDFSGPLFVFSSCFLLAIVFSVPLGISTSQCSFTIFKIFFLELKLYCIRHLFTKGCDTTQKQYCSWLITGFVTRLTRRVPLVEQFYVYVLYIVVCPFVHFHLAIVLSVLLWLTDSDYPFDIFKLVLYMQFFYSRNLTSGVPSLLCVCTLGGRRDDKFQLHIQCFSIHTSLLVTQWTVSMHFYTTSNDTRTTMIPRCSVIDGSKEYCWTTD